VLPVEDEADGIVELPPAVPVAAPPVVAPPVVVAPVAVVEVLPDEDAPDEPELDALVRMNFASLELELVLPLVPVAPEVALDESR
jgi:hypothetical protein